MRTMRYQLFDSQKRNLLHFLEVGEPGKPINLDAAQLEHIFCISHFHAPKLIDEVPRPSHEGAETQMMCFCQKAQESSLCYLHYELQIVDIFDLINLIISQHNKCKSNPLDLFEYILENFLSLRFELA